MKEVEIAKIVKEEYKYISGLITEKRNLEQKLKLMTEAAEVDEILNLDNLETIWREFFPELNPVESEQMVEQLYDLAQRENLSILDLIDAVPQYAEDDYVETIEETNGIGTSLTVKKSTPQNEAVLRKKIFNILKENLLK